MRDLQSVALAVAFVLIGLAVVFYLVQDATGGLLNIVEKIMGG